MSKMVCGERGCGWAGGMADASMTIPRAVGDAVTLLCPRCGRAGLLSGCDVQGCAQPARWSVEGAGGSRVVCRAHASGARTDCAKGA